MNNLEDKSLEELWQLFPIMLHEHNPQYPTWYEEERKSLARSLVDFDVCRISHIGSTAVSGLIAKPIVDILLELPDGFDADALTVLLRSEGWLLMAKSAADQTADFNKGYTPSGFSEKVFHLHITTAGDHGELYFKDYLNAHLEIAQEYEKLKLRLKEQFEHNRDAYTDAKSEFVLEHTQKAKEEFAGRYVPA